MPRLHQKKKDKAFVDSSLSIDEVIAWIADEALRELVDFSDDEGEGVDRFCVEDLHGPVHTLEQSNAQSTISDWPW